MSFFDPVFVDSVLFCCILIKNFHFVGGRVSGSRAFGIILNNKINIICSERSGVIHLSRNRSILVASKSCPLRDGQFVFP